MFPPAERVAACEASTLAACGLTGARARTLKALAQAVVDGALQLQPGSDVEATMRALEALPGIGNWTAQYVAMRALGWPDAFPANDLVVLKALGETRPARAILRSDAWRPWRASAVLHLWRNAA
jgi:AraC family transcriptional regulator of adaptative response / DNA-3-methyladenine glycosylase II